MAQVTVSPIRSKADLKAALARLEEIFDATDGPEADEAEVLAILVEDYEEKAYPVEDVDPVDVLKLHMERMQLSQADLARVLGSHPRASEIMARKRHLTLGMINAISKAWGIPRDRLAKLYEIRGVRGQSRLVAEAFKRHEARKAPAPRPRLKGVA